jgi:ABC-type amino acid transport substrate-binding protein
MIRLKSLLSVTFGAAIMLAALPSAFAAEATFKVGTDPDYRPISFADPSGKLIGVDADFAAELAKHMGKSLNYEGIAWEGIIPALQAGKIDAITNLVITDKRKETVAFSEPYLAQTVTTVVPASKPDLKPSPEALKGLRVGVMVNTAAAGVVAKIAGANATTYNTVADEYSNNLSFAHVHPCSFFLWIYR